MGPGFSFSFSNPNKFSTRFTMAFPLSPRLSAAKAAALGQPERPTNGRDPQYWLDFNIFY